MVFSFITMLTLLCSLLSRQLQRQKIQMFRLQYCKNIKQSKLLLIHTIFNQFLIFYNFCLIKLNRYIGINKYQIRFFIIITRIYMESSNQSEEHLISDYIIQRQIGKGSFGIIYSAKKNINPTKIQSNVEQSSQLLSSFVIKCKQHNNSIEYYQSCKQVEFNGQENLSVVKPMLDLQFKIMTELQIIALNQFKSKENVKPCQILSHPYPFAFQYGQCDIYTYIVMDKLAQTLQNKVKNIKFKVSSASIFNAMYRALQSIQGLHQIGYLHRDIKPGNFMIRTYSLANKKEVTQYLILMDFGLCKKYIDKRNEHIPIKYGKKIIGTPIYCSKNVHNGQQASRRDDLQSWFYTFLHLFCKLPWQTQQILNEKNKELQTEMIKKKKLQFKINQFLKENNLEISLSTIYNKITQLNYSQQPCYEEIYKIMRECVKKHGKDIYKYLFWEKQIEQQPKIQPFQQKPQINIKFSFKQNKKINKIELNQVNKDNLFEKIVKKEEIVDVQQIQ